MSPDGLVTPDGAIQTSARCAEAPRPVRLAQLVEVTETKLKGAGCGEAVWHVVGQTLNRAPDCGPGRASHDALWDASCA